MHPLAEYWHDECIETDSFFDQAQKLSQLNRSLRFISKECRDNHVMREYIVKPHLDHMARKLVLYRFCQHSKRVFEW